MLRRLALMSLFLLVGATAARAEYPDRPVKIVVPVGAGGGVDVMARLLAQRLGDRLHESFVVENHPGAAGIIGSKVVIASRAGRLYASIYPEQPVALGGSPQNTSL